MTETVDAKQLLTGAMHDAQKLITDKRTKEAFTLLKNKISELEKYEKRDYTRVSW
jgi:hypothetical protein